MIAHDVQGMRYYQFQSFPSDRVLHGVFTRLGGASRPPFSSLNLSLSVPDEKESVRENRRRFYSAFNVDPGQAVRTVQVHGAHVAAVGRGDVNQLQPATDGLVTAEPDLPLVMAFADCTPILLYDPVRGAVGHGPCGLARHGGRRLPVGRPPHERSLWFPAGGHPGRHRSGHRPLLLRGG